MQFLLDPPDDIYWKFKEPIEKGVLSEILERLNLDLIVSAKIKEGKKLWKIERKIDEGKITKDDAHQYFDKNVFKYLKEAF